MNIDAKQIDHISSQYNGLDGGPIEVWMNLE
jgi:hypothetical protein